MRKLIVSMNVTLDGFMAGPACELDWHFKSWTHDMAAALCRQLGEADAILLGRVSYLAMARYWTSRGIDLSFPREDLAFAEMMNSRPKIVVSKTATGKEWSNSVVLSDDLEQEIKALRKQPGKDIIIYGSGKLVAALIALGLIDEYQLWIHPVSIGSGKPLFGGAVGRLPLSLVSTEVFSSGVVLITYRNAVQRC